MAQFELKREIEVGKISITNFDELKTELVGALQEYKLFTVNENTYQEAKTKRANLNKFDKALQDARKDIKKQYLEPYENFEGQIKQLSSLVSEVSSSLDNAIKEIEEREKNAKRLEIELFYRELQIPVPLDKIYKKEWENKTYKMVDITKELAELKAKVDSELSYISEHIANDDIILKAQVKSRYLDTLDLIKSIEEETEKNKKIKEIAKQESTSVQLETKDIEVILTVNEKQWYQIQNFIKTIGAKLTKKGN